MIADGVSLRDCRGSDLPFLAWLRNETMANHMISSGAVIDETREMERVKYRLDCAQIIVRNGQDIGLWKVCRDHSPWELSQIQIAPKHQGLGIGTALIERLLIEARSVDVGVKLLVLKANPAKRLYERLGFQVVDVGEVAHAMLWEPSK